MARFALLYTLLGAALSAINTASAAAAAAERLDRINSAAQQESLSVLSERHPSPFNTTCPYAVRTEDEAKSRRGNSSVPGNIVDVENLQYGRLGNHFIALGNVLKLGYCCKSKVVTLPPKSHTMAPGIFNDGTPGPRWFSFTSAPDVVGFDSSTCPDNIRWSGWDAFVLAGVRNISNVDYNPALCRCIEEVPRLLGCEADHFLPVDVDICGTNDLGHHDVDSREYSGPTLISNIDEEENGSLIERSNGTNLVVHVRSGDVFSSGYFAPNYGQPPLQLYLRLLKDYQWNRVDVVTHGVMADWVNPVVTALESKVSSGELLGNIFFHKDRTFDQDLVAMLCAENLATARSTLSSLTAYHSTAARIFFPSSCSSDRNAKHVQHDERVRTKALGAVFDEEHYGPYVAWNNSVEQRTEMMDFDVAGFEQCV